MSEYRFSLCKDQYGSWNSEMCMCICLTKRSPIANEYFEGEHDTILAPHGWKLMQKSTSSSANKQWALASYVRAFESTDRALTHCCESKLVKKMSKQTAYVAFDTQLAR